MSTFDGIPVREVTGAIPRRVIACGAETTALSILVAIEDPYAPRFLDDNYDPLIFAEIEHSRLCECGEVHLVRKYVQVKLYPGNMDGPYFWDGLARTEVQ